MLPCVLALAAGWLLRARRLDLFGIAPALSYAYGDADQGGSSRAGVTLAAHAWESRFELRPGFAFPYAGTGVRFGTPTRISDVDAEGFDSLIVEWRSATQRSIRVDLKAEDPGRTDPSRPLSFVPFEQSLPVERDWSRRSVALRALFLPEWWGKANGASPRLRPELLGHLAGVEFVTGFDSPAPLADTLQVRRLELVGITWTPLGLALLASFSLSLLLSGWLRRLGKPVPRPAVPAGLMRDVRLESHEEMDRRRLLGWLGEHYMEEDLSLEKAGRGAGIHPRRISGLLRDAGGLTFPGYVNSLRLAQAKRLLRETDRTVAEISIAVGIPNVQRFHRLFKSATGRTPLEWRSREDQCDTKGANAN